MAADAPSEGFSNDQALKIIEESGILNPAMPLKDVMNLSRQMASLREPGAQSTAASANNVDFFIHRNFCLYHEE